MKIIRFTLLIIGIAALSAQGQASSTFTVEVTGKGRPMILIPGLTCKGTVWTEAIDRYKDRYQCHTLSLAGFAGAPAVEHEGAFLETVKHDLREYIKANALQRPILIGHSLGGFLSLWLASELKDEIGGLIIVDGLPFYPASMNPSATEASEKPRAAMMRDSIRNATKEQTRARQSRILGNMMNDPADVATAIEWSVASDPNTVAQAMYEMSTIDLRDKIADITAPTLILGAWIGYQPYGATRESTEAVFRAQYEKLASYQLEMTDVGKHFIMWDDPEFLFEKTDAFLAQALP